LLTDWIGSAIADPGLQRVATLKPTGWGTSFVDLLVIGLDGLSDNMLERFNVPFQPLQQVRNAGVSGDLMSVDTPTTGPAWTSFATGTDPGTHGIHNMKEYGPDYTIRSPGVNETEPAIYDLIDDSLFVNLPAAAGRVPQAENSHVVSSILSADKDDTTPDLLKALDSYDDYIPHHDPTKKKRPAEYLEHVTEIAESRTQFARDAFGTFDPRLGFVLYSTTDWAGHILPKLDSADDRAEFYRTLCEVVAEGAAELSDLCDNVVMLSDHGFERKHATVHVADWLRDEGYLVDRGRGSEASVTDLVADAAVTAGTTIARRSDRFYRLARFVHNRLMGTDVGAKLQEAARPDPDYEASLAWGLRYGCVYVNDERFEHPTVDDADALRREIRDGLASLEADGEPLFRDVLLPDEAYADPTAQVPDVIARPSSGHHAITHWSPTGGYTSPTDSFEHRYRGLIAADGPLFDTGTIEGMSIVDVLPTLLAALGEPLLPDFDGEVRTTLLAEEPSLETRSTDSIPVPQMADETATDRDERRAAVEERLADLGYME
jgi:predicted AlkP superfamily phosphohydrolase/phosphomutase